MPEIGGDDALLRMEAAVLCGSDVNVALAAVNGACAGPGVAWALA